MPCSVAVLLVLVLLLAAAPMVVQSSRVKHFTYDVIETQPHSTSFFTQGLCFRQPDNHLIEGTGLPGQSLLAVYSSPSKLVLKRNVPNEEYFGEGVAQVGNELFQLTWQNGKVMVWDSRTLELLRTVNAPKEMREGWGLATSSCGRFLIASEGSAKLFWLRVNDSNTTSIEVDRQVTVRDCDAKDGRVVIGINELESVPLGLTHPEEAKREAPTISDNVRDFAMRLLAGRKPAAATGGGALLWGNVFGTACVAVIDPNTGVLRAYVHLDGLGGHNQEADVLNGIAFQHDGTDTVWLTGKRWDKLYRVRVREMARAPSNYAKKCTATFSSQPKHKYAATMCSREEGKGGEL